MRESKRNLHSFYTRYIFAQKSISRYFGFMDLNSELNQTEQKKWGEVMLQHSFDEEDWIKARSTLIKLLLNDRKVADEEAIRSYISCCAEATSGTYPLPRLVDLVTDFYSQYGMDSAKRRAN